MKKTLFVVLGFFVISIGLTWIWNEWARESYAHLLNTVAPQVYEWIGFEGARVGTHRERYINFVPFVSLVLVTPGISLRRRSIGLGLGLFTLFASHLALNLTERISPGPSLPIVPALVSDSLPFLVWLVVAYPALVKFLPASEEPDSASDESAD